MRRLEDMSTRQAVSFGLLVGWAILGAMLGAVTCFELVLAHFGWAP